MSDIIKAFNCGIAFGLGKARAERLVCDKDFPKEDIIYRKNKHNKTIAINTKTKEVSGIGETERQADLQTAYTKQSAEIQKKIESINIDSTKDSLLPSFPETVLKNFSVENIPIVLKANIVNKNLNHHPEIQSLNNKQILGLSLYAPDSVVKGSATKANRLNFLSRISDKNSTIALVELSKANNRYEVINFHLIRERSRKQKEKLDK